ncbi:hypothetical protein ACOME3_004612 [Neoechinorhynchus agilis]
MDGSIVHLRDQVYEDIVRDCQKKGKLFKDCTFPADNESLGRCRGIYEERGKIEWLRPRHLQENPVFLEDQRADGITQSKYLANCWFAATVSVLVENQRLIQVTTPGGQSFSTNNYFGIFRFRFYQQGQLFEVVVDDRLPYKSRKGVKTPMCLTNTLTPNDFWAPLFEKAYAKLYGSYCAMELGFSSEAFSDCCSGLVEELLLRAFRSKLYTLWRQIVKSLRFGSLVVGATTGGDDRIRPNGIARNHGYSIHKAELIFVLGSSYKLLLLKNPWRDGTMWNRRWSFQDPIWNQMDESDRQRLGYNRYPKSSMFWINIVDFVVQFNYVYIWHKNPCSTLVFATPICPRAVKWHTIRHYGFWNWIKSDRPFLKGPRSVFKVNPSTEPLHIYIRLTQLYVRLQQTSGGFDFQYMQLNLYKHLEEETKQSNFSMVVSSGPYVDLPEVSVFAIIPMGTYMVQCCLAESQRPAEFILTMVTDRQIECLNFTNANPVGGRSSEAIRAMERHINTIKQGRLYEIEADDQSDDSK